jgi:hypothetical protein
MLRNARRLVILAFIVPMFASAATSSVGIPTGGIWFSKEPFFVGDQITVNTLVFNATGEVVRGSLELLDGTVILQQKDVAVDPGDSKVISFPVQVTRGAHTFQIRVAGGDFTGSGGVPIATKSTGHYVGQTIELKRTAVANPALVQSAPIAAPTLADVSTTSPITSSDAQGVADSVEKVIPAKVVEPVVSLAVPVIGATESFRVGQANASTRRISDTINDLTKTIGVEKVLGVSTSTVGSAKSSAAALLSKITAWSIFRTGVTSSNFVQSPFGYIKLFIFLLFHAIISAAWLFYGISAFILFKIFMYVKRLIFPVSA